MTDARGIRYDISIAVGPGTPEWPGDTPFGCGWTLRLDTGGSVNLSRIEMSPHVGSHADAPLHVLDGGAGSGTFPLDVFRGPAHLIELPERCRLSATAFDAGVEWADLAPLVPDRVERLLVRTGASIATGQFPDAWASLTPGCVEALCDRGLRLLGVDAPSVDARRSTALASHKALFARGAYNLENLDLAGVPGGVYELVAYPIRLEALDAAPVRAVLLAPG